METQTPSYIIYFQENINAVVMEWKGYSTSREFRSGTELMLNLLLKHNTFKVLANIKEMVLIGLEDQEWLDTEFLPRATEFGFHVLAIVTPDHYFNKVAVESISQKADKNKLAIKTFENLTDAAHWLSLIDNPDKNTAL
ncbi:hypothetical protein ACQKCJ_19180 [Flavobacterium sp. NPDC079362]|uniref:hypothetical protein n=1 Tax=Flavobacterium sp. NPDC079362 TaxID=3390566 RepID=UPI003D05F280